MKSISVNAERAYEIHLGCDWKREVADLAKDRAHVALVYSEKFSDFVDSFPAISGSLTKIAIPDGETGKSFDSYISIINSLGAAGFTRSDLLVAVGGGAVTDISGFAASSWLRGIDWVAVPTTLAGAVDAAIGGKTGLNSEHGKNLVGAFYSPIRVVIDPSWLPSLSDRDFSAGLAEVIKCGFIKDPEILNILEKHSLDSLRKSDADTLELISRSAQVKASVVSNDFKESGEREILNYGHTMGHAIEKFSQYQLRHGECVSIGMVYVAEIAKAQGLITQEILDLHRELLQRYQLPTSTSIAEIDSLLEILALDKKSRGSIVRFVVLTDIGATSRLEGPSDQLLRSTYERIQS